MFIFKFKENDTMYLLSLLIFYWIIQCGASVHLRVRDLTLVESFFN